MAGVLLIAAMSGALAQSKYPNQPVRVIVSVSPGGGLDTFARLVTRETLLITTASFAISPAIYRSIPYDPLRDFAPITMGVATPNVMVVHPSVPVKSVKEMIALAKARAGQGDPLFYASAGTPQEIVAWVHKETNAILRAADVRERLAVDGLEVIGNSPDELAAVIRSDIAKWTKLVKATGIPLM